MKQMTKEELIEYFIKQLGDNEILGKVMSTEQIRNKLNSIIEDVVYVSKQEDSIAATWYPDLKKIEIDPDEIPDSQEAHLIIHEVLHALSTSIIQEEPDKKKIKVGIGLEYIDETKGEQEVIIYNVALIEGMTDVLSERITGEQIDDGYADEKMLYKMISTMVGEDTILKMYFSDNIVENPYSIFENVIKEKYGEQSGIEINENLRKVLALSDQLTMSEYALDEEGNRLYAELRNEMCDTLASMLEIVIDKEPYSLNRNDLISIIEYYSEDDIKKQLLTNFINSDSLDYDKKIEILQYLNRSSEGSVLAKNILRESSSFTEEEKSNIEASLVKMEKTELQETIYEQYVESGRIIENDTIDKKEIFMGYTNIRIYRPNQELDQYLQKLTYQKVGNYYIVNNHNMRRGTEKIYDSDNWDIEPDELSLKPMDTNSVISETDIRKLSSILQRENADGIVEQLRKQIPALCQENESEYNENVEIVADMLRYRIQGQDGLIYDEFFEVNSNGELELIQKR